VPPLRGWHSFARSPTRVRSTGYARKLAPLVALRDAHALTTFGYCRSSLALASLRSQFGLASLTHSQGLASSPSLTNSLHSQARSVRSRNASPRKLGFTITLSLHSQARSVQRLWLACSFAARKLAPAHSPSLAFADSFSLTLVPRVISNLP
jgi:hypothetical protein